MAARTDLYCSVFTLQQGLSLLIHHPPRLQFSLGMLDAAEHGTIKMATVLASGGCPHRSRVLYSFLG